MSDTVKSPPLVPRKLKKREREPSLRTLKWSGVGIYEDIEKDVQAMDENVPVPEPQPAPLNLQNISVASPKFVLAKGILAASPQRLAPCSPSPAANTRYTQPFSSASPSANPSPLPPSASTFRNSTTLSRKHESAHAVMDHVDDWRKEVERELETLREHFRKREAELDKKYAPLRALSETLASCPDLAKHLQRIGQDLEKNADLAGSRAYLKAAGLFGSIEAQYVYGKNAGDYEALLRAAELGHPDAMLDLAKMMESGGQTSEAVRWYGEAEKRGNALAQMARITLQTRVTKEDKARRQSHLVLTGDDGDSDCDDDCGNEHGDKDRDAQLMNEMMGGNSDA